MKSLTTEIRLAKEEDVLLLEALHRHIFTEPWQTDWSARSYREIMAMPGATGWVLSEGTEPIGMVLLLVASDQAELILIGVIPAARRKGLGRRLLDRACLEAARMGAKKLFLEHAADAKDAIAFYSSAGFALAGARPNYYRGRSGSRDAVVLVKELVVETRSA